jgi:hypothetical protein
MNLRNCHTIILYFTISDRKLHIFFTEYKAHPAIDQTAFMDA